MTGRSWRRDDWKPRGRRPFRMLAPQGILLLLLLSCHGGRALSPQQRLAYDLDAQRQSMASVRATGTALMMWLTDQVSATAAGASLIRVAEYPLLSGEDVEQLLVPEYLPAAPVDGWGHPLEVRVALDDLLASRVLMVRSAGRDGRFEADAYEIGPFGARELERDIVWADGSFIRWPIAD